MIVPSLQETIDKLRLESTESMQNYEKSMEKYQILMKQSAHAVYQRTLYKKGEFF